MNHSSRVAAVLSGLAGLTLLAGCGAGNAVTEAIQKVMLPSIAIGECTDLDGSEEAEEVTELPTVSCDTAHKWETFAEKQFGLEDAFPGEAGIETAADEFCTAEFTTFVGATYDESAYELQYLYPTQASWTTLGDRTITCLIGLSEGGVVGTLKGAEA